MRHSDHKREYLFKKLHMYYFDGIFAAQHGIYRPESNLEQRYGTLWTSQLGHMGCLAV